MWGKIISKWVETIELVKDIMDLVRHLLNPSNLAMLATFLGAFKWMFGRFQKTLDARQDGILEKLAQDITEVKGDVSKLRENAENEHQDMKTEILRVQILTGIDSKRLSASELSYFFDKYKKLGGNSFVEEKCKAYLEELEKGDAV